MWDVSTLESLYEVACRALPLCCPNPAVGAIFVSERKEILAEGHTQPYGESHAEIVAIQNLEKNHSLDALRKGTLYVTLTPCCYEGKTSSCVDFLLQKGIRKICIVHDDPNPLVYKNSLQKLQNAGVQVDMQCPDLYKEKFFRLNEIFFSRFCRNTPWVTLKYAMTLDGKISTVCGDSKWISCDVSRKNVVQYLRSMHGAISVGDNTVVKDDPQLTVWNFPIKNPPKRVIFNMGAPISMQSKIFSSEAKTIIVLPFTALENYKNSIISAGHEILEVPPRPDLKEVLRQLKIRQVDSILLEGGAKLMSWFGKERMIDKVFCFIAPKILGSKGISPFDSGDENLVQNITQSITLQNVFWEKCGETFLISGYPCYPQDE